MIYCNRCRVYTATSGPAHVCEPEMPMVITGGYVPPPPCESCKSLRRENEELKRRLGSPQDEQIERAWQAAYEAGCEANFGNDKASSVKDYWTRVARAVARALGYVVAEKEHEG